MNCLDPNFVYLQEKYADKRHAELPSTNCNAFTSRCSAHMYMCTYMMCLQTSCLARTKKKKHHPIDKISIGAGLGTIKQCKRRNWLNLSLNLFLIQNQIESNH